MKSILIITVIFFLNFAVFPNEKKTDNLKKDNFIKSYETINDETDRIAKIYKIIIKSKNIKNKLDKLPIKIAIWKGEDNFTDFFTLDKTEDKNSSFEIIIYKNIIEDFYKTHLSRILKEKFKNEKDEKLIPENFYLNILLHTISHFTGQFMVKNTDKENVPINTLLGDKFQIIEEIRADTEALSITKILVEEEIIDEEIRTSLFKNHIAYLLYLSKLTGNKQKVARLEYNYFLKKNILIEDIDSGKIAIDFTEYEKAVISLKNKAVSFEKGTSKALAKMEEFLIEFSDIKKETETKQGEKND